MPLGLKHRMQASCLAGLWGGLSLAHCAEDHIVTVEHGRTSDTQVWVETDDRRLYWAQELVRGDSEVIVKQRTHPGHYFPLANRIHSARCLDDMVKLTTPWRPRNNGSPELRVQFLSDGERRSSVLETSRAWQSSNRCHNRKKKKKKKLSGFFSSVVHLWRSSSHASNSRKRWR